MLRLLAGLLMHFLLLSSGATELHPAPGTHAATVPCELHPVSPVLGSPVVLSVGRRTPSSLRRGESHCSRGIAAKGAQPQARLAAVLPELSTLLRTFHVALCRDNHADE